MTSSKLNALPALRRQHLLVEFAGLKQACPEGVFVSLTPGDPSLWSGILFVRDGPYAPAVLRFQISFPDSYPQLPPLITFSTDMFHPLITPLSTYMYSTDVQDDGTVSATDAELLPPGGFSLRHGFPNWFRRQSRNTASVAQQGRQQDGLQTPHRPPPPSMSSASTPGSKGSAVGSSPGFAQTSRKDTSTYEVLWYIQSAFGDEDVLDSIPLEASGNPGAWHAWRAHRVEGGKVFCDNPPASTGAIGAGPSGATASDSVRKPGDWNWEGVWEERVKKAVSASLSEPVLFGGVGAADDVIRFLNMEENDVDTVKDNLLRTLSDSS
ncbi:UBC-like protein [Durotheca rogersii]|uniref:UBC-like protein n=1 Tax=Durotheca rogersii TaxID=419775 RepID=UPI00221F478B|nr:UBC-like protein [Durotheca rogersii]KAI5868522.1 UBC-like protein [Durotheca rogersii]